MVRLAPGLSSDLHRRCGHQLAVLAEQDEDDLEIDGVRERAGVDERVRQRVRRVERDGASAERFDHVDGDVGAGVPADAADGRAKGAVFRCVT